MLHDIVRTLRHDWSYWKGVLLDYSRQIRGFGLAFGEAIIRDRARSFDTLLRLLWRGILRN